MEGKRGSDKLRAAWEQRSLTDQSISEIAEALDSSPASVDAVEFHGGGSPTGLSVALSYSGDDIDYCGNDISFWINWNRRHGTDLSDGRVVLINGVLPDIFKVRLPFGNVEKPNLDRQIPGR